MPKKENVVTESLIEFQVVLQQRADGSTEIGVTLGSPSVAQVIGLLELAKFDLLVGKEQSHEDEMVEIEFDEIDFAMDAATGFLKDKKIGDKGSLPKSLIPVREMGRKTFIESREIGRS